MSDKSKAGCLIVILWVCISLPMTLWLQAQILQRVGASDLMWFVFWLNVPVAVAISVIGNMFRD